jgi:hypothetical protein
VANTVKLTPAQLAAELLKLEREHGMSSVVFFEKYQAGEMGDSKDVMRWAWLWSVALRTRTTAPSIPA